MEDLVNATLENLVEPAENQWELSPVEENPDNKGGDFWFFDEEHPD